MVKIRKSPGVYVEEVSNLAPSVASVATAIPAFVGYTEKGAQNEPIAVTSYLEYVNTFGEGPVLSYKDGKLSGAKYVMNNAIRMYFDNGGGKCYIVSVGNYDYVSEPSSSDKYVAGLEKIKAVDEVTLLACPDAGMLLGNNTTQLNNVHVAMLDQAADTMDRFAILDVVDTDSNLTNFKKGIAAAKDISYGAAYYPNVKHSYTTDFDNETVANYLAEKNSDVMAVLEEDKTEFTDEEAEIKSFYEKLKSDTEIEQKIAKNHALYKSALAELQDMASVITPSGAVVGAIVSTDSRVGVWKAPANIGIASVADVTKAISTSEQDDINVDANTGISINCIRKFFGKGILIWGARTLDGLDNEWRYIPVRRLFNYIEESVQKSTMWAVFEPNDVNTWVKIKCQISNFLTNLWRQGALVGATPNDAYFVNVGVPTTMTTDDVLNGRLIVEVGIAASRPAEFITLVFSHKIEQ